MRSCVPAVAIACLIGAPSAQAELLQYVFEGYLDENPFSDPAVDMIPGGGLFSWSLWIDTTDSPTSVNAYINRYDGIYSELIVGDLMVAGPASLSIVNDAPVDGTPETIDYYGARFADVPSGFSEFDFRAGFLGPSLIDNLELLTDPMTWNGPSSFDGYSIEDSEGHLYSGFTAAETLQILPAPGAVGLFATVGVVGARRRR